MLDSKTFKFLLAMAILGVVAMAAEQGLGWDVSALIDLQKFLAIAAGIRGAGEHVGLGLGDRSDDP